MAVVSGAGAASCRLMNEPGRLSGVFSSAAVKRSCKRSLVMDRLSVWVVAAGGLGVLAALCGIGCFLLIEAFPLLSSATVVPAADFALPDEDLGSSVFVAIGPQSERGLRLTADGAVICFSLTDGQVMGRDAISLPSGLTITRAAPASNSSDTLALGLSNGSVLPVALGFGLVGDTADSRRKVSISYPLGQDPWQLELSGPLTMLTLRPIGDAYLILGASAAGTRGLLLSSAQRGPVADPDWAVQSLTYRGLPAAREALISAQGQWLYLLDAQGSLHVFRRDGRVLQPVPGPIHAPEGLQSLAFLVGDESVIALGASGAPMLWFMVRQEGAGPEQARLTAIRQFETGDGPPVHLLTEQRRRGFVTLDGGGQLSLYYSTASRPLLQQHLTDREIATLVLSPRADRLLAESEDGRMAVWTVRNDHPEVSWQALWNKVWYETYPEPAYVWQSSAATSDFESKLSLMPLVFGTLKAACYALLLATPLAIGGAAFTAYFMAPAMRRWVKPLIELMEALPTVVVGLLAGIWLAPVLDVNLVALIIFVLLMPAAVIVAAYLWHVCGFVCSLSAPGGWQSLLLVPIIGLAAWGSMAVGPLIEVALFDGSFRNWLSQDMGVFYDQRNALVVGVAMGFAVIPTIFSIAEDAIFAVPRHLTMGALALGARPWQVFWGVVMPTASPAVFSALIIGFGRAAGETMIVLMATGNTPIMDFNLFEGMRTLAANLSVEAPEAAVGSTHYRVLIFTGLILFGFTFVVNTAAEVVRQRLRERYGSI